MQWEFLMKKLIGAVSCLCSLFLSEMTAAADLPEGWTKMETNHLTAYSKMSSGVMLIIKKFPEDVQTITNRMVQNGFIEAPYHLIGTKTLISRDNIIELVPLGANETEGYLTLCTDTDFKTCVSDFTEFVTFMNRR